MGSEYVTLTPACALCDLAPWSLIVRIFHSRNLLGYEVRIITSLFNTSELLTET